MAAGLYINKEMSNFARREKTPGELVDHNVPYRSGISCLMSAKSWTSASQYGADLKLSANVSAQHAHKAIVRCKLINKCFVSRHMPTLVMAFKFTQAISDRLSPRLVKDIELVESVQRRFAKSSGYRNFVINVRRTAPGHNTTGAS